MREFVNYEHIIKIPCRFSTDPTNYDNSSTNAMSKTELRPKNKAENIPKGLITHHVINRPSFTPLLIWFCRNVLICSLRLLITSVFCTDQYDTITRVILSLRRKSLTEEHKVMAGILSPQSTFTHFMYRKKRTEPIPIVRPFSPF